MPKKEKKSKIITKLSRNPRLNHAPKFHLRGITSLISRLYHLSFTNNNTPPSEIHSHETQKVLALKIIQRKGERRKK